MYSTHAITISLGILKKYTSGVFQQSKSKVDPVKGTKKKTNDANPKSFIAT